jgi:hypothetical protein
MTKASDNPTMRHELGMSEVDGRELPFGKKQNIGRVIGYACLKR